MALKAFSGPNLEVLEGHDTKLGHFLKQLWHGTVSIIMIRWPGNCLDHYTPIYMYFMGYI